tara:strand:+ start:6808 stop:7947 length:1140 start_codon:yes stop_codon:yes gene_type:complete
MKLPNIYFFFAIALKTIAAVNFNNSKVESYDDEIAPMPRFDVTLPGKLSNFARRLDLDLNESNYNVMHFGHPYYRNIWDRPEQEKQPFDENPTYDPWVIPAISFGGPGLLVALFAAGIIMIKFCDQGNMIIRIAKMLVFAFAVVGGDVLYMELLQLQPRLLTSPKISFFLSMVVYPAFSTLILPFGVCIRGVKEARKLLFSSFLLAIFFQMYMGFLVSALKSLSAATMSVVMQSAAAVVYPLSVCILNEKFSWNKVMLVGLSIAGLLTIVSFNRTISNGKIEPLIGYVAAIFWVLSYSFYQIIQAKFLPKLPPNSEITTHVGHVTLFLGLRGFWGLMLGIPTYLAYVIYAQDFSGFGTFPTSNEAMVVRKLKKKKKDCD